MMKKIQTLSGLLALAMLLLFPLLTWAQPPTFGGGTGAVNDPYLISTKAHFEALVKAVQEGESYAGKDFLQTADIDLENATFAPFALRASYIGGYHILSNFSLELSETTTELAIFATVAATIFDNVTIKQPAEKKLSQLTKFRIVREGYDVSFRNVNAELNLGTRTTGVSFLFAEYLTNAVVDNCKLSVEIELGAIPTGDIQIQFLDEASKFLLLNGDLTVSAVKSTEFSGNVNLNASLVDKVECAVLVGNRVVNVTGTGAGAISMVNDAAVHNVTDFLLYSSEAYSDINKVCATASSQRFCLGMTEDELKMDVAKAKTIVLDGQPIYTPTYLTPRFVKGAYPAPRWYRALQRHQRLMALENTPSTPFEIENVDDWIIVTEATGALQFVKLATDIDFAAYGEVIRHPGKSSGKDFVFDGAGHTIKGLTYNAPEAEKCEKFALFKDGKIRNVVLEGANLSFAMAEDARGDFACLAIMPDELENCTLNNCKLTISSNNTTGINMVSAGLVASSLVAKGKALGITINNSELTVNGKDIYGTLGIAIAKIQSSVLPDRQTVAGIVANDIKLTFDSEAESGTFMVQAGGLFGLVAGADISRCGVSGIIRARKAGSVVRLGGFSGSIAGGTNIAQCYAKVDVEAMKVNTLGGFVGEAHLYNYKISDCYAAGILVLEEGKDVAGFVGFTDVNSAHTSIENCYVKYDSFIVTSTNTRPFVSYPSIVTDVSHLGSFLKNCYYTIEGYPSGAKPALLAKANNNMSDVTGFDSWDFKEIWMPLSDAPVLRWEKLVAWQPEGDGSEAKPYLIATLDNLRWLSENPSIWIRGAHFKQTNDIDASDTKNWNKKGAKSLGFRPIGDATRAFHGTYDGGNKLIRNLFIGADEENVGFFGLVDGGVSVLKNIRLENLTIAAGDAAKCVGGLVAQTDMSEVKITGCHITLENLSAGVGTSSVGGFAGYLNNVSVLEQSSATAANTTTAILAKKGNVGGFVGTLQADNGKLEKLYTNINVVEAEGSSVNTMGGFVGYISGGATTVLQNAYSLGNVNFRSAGIIGAFVGEVHGTTKIQTTYTAGKVQDINGTESVLKPDAGFGGALSGGTLSKNYYQKKQGDKEITSPNFDAAGKCTALDKEKMQSGNPSDMPGFETTVWKFQEGKYPEFLGNEMPKMGTITIEKVGDDEGEIAITVGGVQVTNGGQYTVGSVVKIKVTVYKPQDYAATVTVNNTPLALTHGEATYVVVEGDNAIKVAITKVVKAAVTVEKVGEDKGTIAVTIDGTEVTSGNQYAVGAVVKIKVTLNDPANSVAMVTANGVPLALTHGEATYAVVEGSNAIKVVIAEGKKAMVTVEKVGEDKGTIAVTVDGAEVVSGNEYFVGVVISFKVTVSDPTKYEARVIANGKGIKLTNGEGTYAIVEGNNAIKVVIASKSTPTPPPSAVEDVAFANVVVSPNPFANQLRITGYELRGEYALYNAQGFMVVSGVLDGSETHINTSSFPAGMYLLRLRVENGATKTYRVVKQ